MMADSGSLFWIDNTNSHSPTMEFYTIGTTPGYTSDNPNPDMTTKPLTFSGTYTFMIVIVSLVLAILLVWLQRLFFKWRASKWIDDSDIPGSKVTEEVQEGDHEHGGEGGNSTVPIPPYSETDKHFTASAPLMTGETSSVSDLHRADELELVAFSSHPRPNVITIIPDEPTEHTEA